MIKRDLLKYSKLYVQLEELEIKLRDASNLGIHLKAANPALFKKLDDAADAIYEYFNRFLSGRIPRGSAAEYNV